MLGKTEGRRRGQQRIRWVDGIIDLMDMSLSNLQELVNGKEDWTASYKLALGIREMERLNSRLMRFSSLTLPGFC